MKLAVFKYSPLSFLCAVWLQVSDYLEVIKEPMDLSTVITKIDKHNYLTAKDFLTDIDLICSNALEYNPDKDPGGKICFILAFLNWKRGT